MNETVLDQIRRDVFERPKSTIDLDYLQSLKAQVKDLADKASSKLKKNVYENYSLFIESSREISHLKEEMRTLNNLLEQKQDSLNKLLDQLNKNTLVQQNLDRPKVGRPTFEIINDMPEDMLEEIEPKWLKKVPEDLDILIAQHEFEEGVELAKKIKRHLKNYPSVKAELKFKIDSNLEELVNSICSELQGSSKSAIISIKLLKELNLSSRAVKIYLNKRSSVLKKEKIEPTLQSVKKVTSIYFNILTETCNEFKKAFNLYDVPQNVDILKGELPAPAYTVLKFWVHLEIENLKRLFLNLPPSILTEANAIVKSRSSELVADQMAV